MDGRDDELAIARTMTDAGRVARPERAAPHEGLVGARLAHFRLDDKLGEGGMGVVYRATDLSLDRPVAVKILPDAVAGDPHRRERFYREARSQARVRHPNVCHIYYVGEEDGHLFFAMELIEGETLAQRLDRAGKLPADEAIEVCLGAARGLQAAHALGFTHRDVKPSNLMIDRDGTVKLVDFGLVTPGDGRAGGGGPVAATIATVGTPLYMAPEQARGEPVDFRADIYALGATLHELVSGAPPFSGETVDALAERHASADRPAIQGRKAPTDAEVVDDLCDRMMAKHPGDRFPSYDDLIAVLGRASTRRSPPVRGLVRWLAAGIDVVTVGLVARLAHSLLDLAGLTLPREGVLMVLALGIYFTLAWSRHGRTIGMATFHLELVPTDRLGRPPVRQVVRRLWETWKPALVGIALVEAAGLASWIAGPGIGWIGWAAAAGFLAIGVGVVRVFAVGMWASARGPRRRTPWDRRSRTDVVLRGFSGETRL